MNNITFYTPNSNKLLIPGSNSKKSSTRPKPLNLGQNFKPRKSNNSILKKMTSYFAAGIFTYLGITSSCTDGKKFNGVENLDGIKVEYFNVKPETKDSTIIPLINLRKKLTPENDFLKGVEIDITGSYRDLDNANSFRKYLKNDASGSSDKGCSFYSDKKLPRRIAIQESGHNTDKIFNFIKNGKYSAVPSLRQALMHEVAHQFDQFFGHDHNEKFALKWDSIQYENEKNPLTNPYDIPADLDSKKARVIYHWNCGMSDKQEFHNALLKDFKNLAKIKEQHPEKVAGNINYFLGLVDLSQEITPEVVDLADGSRSEIYANLFSYAIGENDGEKEKFVENFKNCYKVVKKHIKDKLNINVDSLKSLKR